MATSEFAKFIDDVDEKVLTCAVCLRRIQSPKSLSCLHSFCLACLTHWVQTNGKLTCPTCRKLNPIPVGGLQKLPPNTFLNDLLETIEQFTNVDLMKCACGKGESLKYYCKECRQHFCCTCREYHKMFRDLANHKLYTMEDIRTMSPAEINALKNPPPTCSIHNEPLKMFCQVCNVAICIPCSLVDHKEWEGKHKLINISEAFQTLKNTSAVLVKSAKQCQNTLQDGINAVVENATRLEQCKEISLREIDTCVNEMLNEIIEKGEKIKEEVETIYNKKKNISDVQLDVLITAQSDIIAGVRFLNQLVKNDESYAVQSGDKVIKTLEKRISELPDTKPGDNGYISFVKNQDHFASSKQSHFGDIIQTTVADYLHLQGEDTVTDGQIIVFKITEADGSEFKINEVQLTTKWTEPTGRISFPQIEEDDIGSYKVLKQCRSRGVCRLDVRADNISIKMSPMIIKVEKQGLLHSIETQISVITHAVKCEDDCLLVSGQTNVIHKYKISGEYISKITLPEGVKVYSMYNMKNTNIALSDQGNNCIKVCNTIGQVIKSIGEGVLKCPFGIHVDEISNTVYVADGNSSIVYIFNMDNGQIRRLGSTGEQEGQFMGVIDVALTNQGYLLAIEYNNANRLQIFDNAGKFMKVLIKEGDHNNVKNPWGVVVDADDNIVISSEHKLQLFNSDGKFIKRIDKNKDKINFPIGLSIISHRPRRVAVANHSDVTVKIFNY